MIIRAENESDIDAIFEITKQAFENHPFSQNTEQYIINVLRKDGALTLSLVAEIDDKVVGHIAFSPVTISDGRGDWYVLGPVSVKPELQRQGIGQVLIWEGLSQLKSLGANGCVLVGPPEYYNRFGFKSHPDIVMIGIPQDFVLSLLFHGKMAKGSIIHHHAFSVINEE
ncbi:GNAT family N-acetyltransferase [Thermoproteota archaeon]